MSRLYDIRVRAEGQYETGNPVDDVDWLLAEVDRLRGAIRTHRESVDEVVATVDDFDLWGVLAPPVDEADGIYTGGPDSVEWPRDQRGPA